MNVPVARRADRIYLAGFMGSGKSTIGPILANTLGFDFVDIDRLIEEQEKVSITAIFRTKGERYFREIERALILKVCLRPRAVISLGGGTLVDPETFHIIRSTGILVYLKLTTDELFRRLKHREDRPLLTGPEGERLAPEDLRQRIEMLHRERQPLYESADVTILTDELRVGITVDRLVRLLAPLLG